IVSTQDAVAKAITTKLGKWEREGWVGVPHRLVLKCLAAELKARTAETVFRVAASGSAAQALCREAKQRAKVEAGSNTPGQVVLTIPWGMALPGVSLQGNKQKIFYRAIREVKEDSLSSRPSTEHKLKLVRTELKRSHGKRVTDEAIWCSLQNKDFLPRPAQFLWRAMHNAHRVGSYWKHIPECEDRELCQECGVTEDLEHILVNCEAAGAGIIWKAAEKLWLEREKEWKQISLGSILGCGLVNFKDEEGKASPGARRLYRILVSESAFTIWKIRNDRVISQAGEPLTETAIINKWIFNINKRLQQDVVLANRPPGRKRPCLAPKLVRETWSGILDDEEKLLENWLRGTRVLVGRRALTKNQLRCRKNDGVG
ncbi:hypothetical protein B0H12DRAFT_1031287, partial [Mycena haematopus]